MQLRTRLGGKGRGTKPKPVPESPLLDCLTATDEIARYLLWNMCTSDTFSDLVTSCA